MDYFTYTYVDQKEEEKKRGGGGSGGGCSHPVITGFSLDSKL